MRSEDSQGLTDKHKLRDVEVAEITHEMIKTMNEPNQIPLKVFADIIKPFTYHAPREGQPLTYQQIRDWAKSFAMLLAGLCPESRERSLALTHLEEVVFWANASIARSPTTGAPAPGEKR